MSRGYIYEISDNIDTVGNMDQSDFYESISALEVDFVANIPENQQAELREAFIQMLKSCGAVIRLVTDTDPEEFSDGVYAVTGLKKKKKKNFFYDRFKRMKQLAESITLTQFAIDSNDKRSLPLYHLKKAIEEDYGDMVYLNSSWYTVDYFIRTADPNRTYYIGNVVCLD